MLLHIYDHLSIRDVQDQFATCFPGLSISFYKKAHHKGEGNFPAERVDEHESLGVLRTKGKEGELDIKSWFTVAQVEQVFHKRYGLNVQVMRNENGQWIQTTSTDLFSLDHQMQLSKQAKATYMPPSNDPLEEYDYL